MKSIRGTIQRLLLGFAAMFAASGVNADDTARVDTLVTCSLSTIPGLVADSIDMGDLYLNATVEMHFTAGSDGKAADIKVKSFKACERSGWNRKELKCARRILEAGCRQMISGMRWSAGKKRCTILWERNEKREEERPLDYTPAKSIYSGNSFMDRGMQEQEANGSGYILVEFDNEGWVRDIEYLGCIIWCMKEYAAANLGNLRVYHNGRFNNGRYTSSGTISTVRVHEGNDVEHERRVRNIVRIIKRYTKKRAKELRATPLPALGGKVMCFEVNVCGVNGPVEVSAPRFPGGPVALTEYIKEKLNNAEEIRNCRPEGTVTVSFKIGKDGSVGRADIERKSLEKLTFAGEQKRSIAIKAVRKAVYKFVEEMPHWIPGTRNGINNENICTLEIEL